MASTDVSDLWPVQGGPLARVQRAMHLSDGTRGDLVRVILVLCAIAWVPFVVLGLLRWWRSGAPEPLLVNLTAHARLLVALPLMVIGEWLVTRRCKLAIEGFLHDGFVTGSEARAAKLVRSGQRLRDSGLVEILTLALVAGLGVASLAGRNPVDVGGHDAGPTTAAVIYHALVSRPIFQFLMIRLLWRWLVWAWMLFGFARLDLRLLATHPDRCGGLRLLALPSMNLGFFLASLSAVLAAGWAVELAAGRLRLTHILPEVFTFVASGLLLALGPLLAFVPRLLRAKRDGIHTYGHLATDYTTQFDRRWVGPGKTDGVLGTSDIQSLADMGNSYEVVEESRALIFERHDVIGLVVAMLLPLLPLLLFEVPIDVLLRRVAGSLFELPGQDH